MSEKFSITNMTKNASRGVPFAKMKDVALGKNYSVSLVFIGKSESKRLNKKYRHKDKPTNILSFPLDENTGEIFITPEVVKREAKLFDRKYDNFISFLFIHGLMHLKGYTHSSTMDRAEEKLRKQFGI